MHAGRALRFVAACLLLDLTVQSCASTAPRGLQDPSACARLDSLYATSGFHRPLSLNGRITVDAEQNQVRGTVALRAESPGELVLEFTSTILFGQTRENLVLASLGDTLRIVDRERGAYYEGKEAEAFLQESLRTDVDIRRVLRLALGGRPPCQELSDIRFEADAGGVLGTGRHQGERFRVFFGRPGRLESAEWPVWSAGRGRDTLRVSYGWTGDGSTLTGVVVSLERHGWRCRIRAA